jgi:Na+/melibiose symporter-like transporter
MRLTANINRQEKRTFMYHFSYSFIEGIISGVLVLNEFVFLKSMQGSPYQVAILFKFSMVVLLAAVFVNEGLHRIRNRKKMIWLTALITRLPLLALLFFPRNIGGMGADTIYHYLFLLIFLVFYLATPVIFPAINLLLKHNYTAENFGRLYSWATSVKKITTLVATFLYGIILDLDPFAFRYVYPLVAVLGIASIYLLSSIDYNPVKSDLNVSKTRIFRSAINRVAKIFRTNKPYLHYQVAFMFYGIAFMATNSVITLFYDRAVGLSYSSVAFYKNFYNLIAIFILPVFGRILAHTDPRRFATLTYSFLALYLLSFPATLLFPAYIEVFGLQIYYMLLAGVLFNSGFIATMAISWSIGSAYFCNASEAGDYQSVHLSLVGLRAMFIPLAGIFIYEIAGFTFTFILAAVLLAAGIIVLEWSGKKYKIDKA